MEDLRHASPQPPAPAPTVRPSRQWVPDLVRLWSVIIPRRIESWAPRLADALADGAWTAIWPRVTAFAPIAGLAVGFGVAVLLPLLPGDYGSFSGIPRVWSELLPFMMLVIAAGILSGTAGIGLLAGYIAGDLLWLAAGPIVGTSATWYLLSSNPVIGVLQVAASALVGYLLLAIPAVTVPLIARRLARRSSPRRVGDRRIRAVARAGVYLVAAGLLTFLWASAVVVLIRPTFAWRNGAPPLQAIEPAQSQWEWLVAAAVVAVLLRILLQELVVRISPRAKLIAALQSQRRIGASPGAFWDRLGPIPVIAVLATTATLLLGGTYEDFIDPVVVFVVSALALAWRAGWIAPTAWADQVERIPELARLAVAVGLGYVLARTLLEVWTTDSLRPVLIAILLIVALIAALFPGRALGRKPAQAVAA